MKQNTIFRTGIAIVLAIKYIVFASFLAVLSVTAMQAHAQAICVEGNLLPELKKQNPELYWQAQSKADAVWINGNSKFWKIEKQGLQPSYLFGTAHVTDPRVLELSQPVQSAFHQSSKLIIEIKNLQQAAQAAFQDMQLKSKIFFTNGETLEDYLSDTQAQSIKERLDKGATPWFLAKRMRPWLVMGMLATSECENQRRLNGQQVLDAKLNIIAEQMGKDIIGLETVKEQFNALSGIDFDTQIEGLKEIAGQIDVLDDLSGTLTNLYLQGEIGLIWPILTALSDPEGEDQSERADFERRVVIERNLRMVDRSLPHLEKGGVFIAVGALHLPGETGFVSLLRKAGYVVSEAN